jgi:hypothetical protein
MTTMSRHRTVVAAASLATMLAVLATMPVAAVDGVATLGSPPPDEQATTDAAPADPMDAMLEFAACMRENGVDMQDPQAAGGGMMMVIEADVDGDGDIRPDGAFMAAEETCRGHLEAVESDADPVRDAELMEGLLAYAECMRSQGIDMPDPVVSGGRIQIGAGPDEARIDADVFDPFSEGYAAAEEACRDVSPFAGLGDFSIGAP